MEQRPRQADGQLSPGEVGEDLHQHGQGKAALLSVEIFSSSSQVIRRFRSLTDRTNLPTELQAELETVRSQEREWSSRNFQHRERR